MVYAQPNVKSIEFVYMYEVLGKVIGKTFKTVIPVWGVYRTRDSTGNLVVGGKEPLGRKAKEEGESISIPKCFHD